MDPVAAQGRKIIDRVRKKERKKGALVKSKCRINCTRKRLGIALSSQPERRFHSHQSASYSSLPYIWRSTDLKNKNMGLNGKGKKAQLLA